MVSESDLLIKLKKQLANYDEAALEALANKGLLRRAGKDLGNGLVPEFLTETATAIEFRVGDAAVKMDQLGPVKSVCNCPATDICRHILITCLWLHQQAIAEPAATTTPSITTQCQATNETEKVVSIETQQPAICDELLKYSLDELTKWAGKKTLRQALEKLSQADVEIQHEGAIVVNFPEYNAVCRYFPGSGLAGMICSCRDHIVCIHLIGAVLAYQHANGIVIIEPVDKKSDDEALMASRETPRTRSEVLTAAKRFLLEIITVGICHLSDASQQRAATLAISATGVALPKLSLMMRAIADDLALALKRAANADNERLFLTVAQTYALISALQQHERSDLVGRSRTSYEKIGTLDLAGLGAYQWQTRSGYRGLTVLFWDSKAKQWYSWTEARPAFHQSDYNPQNRYLQDGPWNGVRNPAQASASIIKLRQAYRNYQNRLSATSRSQAMIAGYTDPTSIDFGNRRFTNWQQLRDYAQSINLVGLAEYDPLKELVLIQPADFGERQFIESAQQFIWPVFDRDGDQLSIKISYSETNKAAINKLEKLVTDNLFAMLVKLNSSGKHLSLYPISVLMLVENGPAVINLTFNSELDIKPVAVVVNNETAPQSAESEEADDDDDDALEITEPPVINGEISQRIDALSEELQKLAERGNSYCSSELRNYFSISARDFQGIGLRSLSIGLMMLADSGADLSEQILRVRYICLLANQLIS